jgi:AcrR family transcriptional regulator
MSSHPAATGRRAATRARRAEARERIVAAAERLLRERPYRDLSVEDVMAEAGLSRTVFYRHFDGLPELMLGLLESIRAELAAELSGEPGPGFTRAVLEAAVDVYGRHGPFLRAVAEAASHDAAMDAAYRDVVDGFTAMMAALAADSMAAGRMRPGDPHEVARALNLMNIGYLTDTLGRDPDFDRTLALETLASIWAAVATEDA